MLFLLFHKYYGDDDVRVTQQGEKCDLHELETLLSKGVRNTPRVVFARLSNTLIDIQSEDCLVCSAPEDLLRLRSSVLAGALRFRRQLGQSHQPLKMTDVKAKYVNFIIHYVSRPLHDVNWDQLSYKEKRRFLEIADEYMIS